jgi:thiamine kinase-like enzyme
MEAWFNKRLTIYQDFGVVDQAQEGFRGLFGHLVMCYLDLHPRNLILDSEGRVWLLD